MILFFIPFGIFFETVGSSETYFDAGKTVGQQGFAFVVASCLGMSPFCPIIHLYCHHFSFDCQHSSCIGHIILDGNKSFLHLGLDSILLCSQFLNV